MIGDEAAIRFGQKGDLPRCFSAGDRNDFGYPIEVAVRGGYSQAAPDHVPKVVVSYRTLRDSGE